MGTTLKIEPESRKKITLSYEIKKALQNKCNGIVNEQRFDKSDLMYFQALLNTGINDAQIVIDMITNYDSVIISEE